MDKLSVAKLLLVTLPENLCNLYIAFLLTGYRLKLPFRDDANNRKKNILKFGITLILFCLIQYVGRAVLSDMGTFFIVNVFLSIATLRYMYGKKHKWNKEIFFLSNIVKNLKEWKKPLVQVMTITIILLIVESIYMPSLFQAFNISLSDAYLPQYQWINLVFPQIDRFFQILIISLAWNYERVKQNILNDECNKFLHIATFTYIILSEFIIVYLYLKSFNTLSLSIKIFIFAFCIGMNIGNLFWLGSLINIFDRGFSKRKRNISKNIKEHNEKDDKE